MVSFTINILSYQPVLFLCTTDFKPSCADIGLEAGLQKTYPLFCC